MPEKSPRMQEIEGRLVWVLCYIAAKDIPPRMAWWTALLGVFAMYVFSRVVSAWADKRDREASVKAPPFQVKPKAS